MLVEEVVGAVLPALASAEDPMFVDCTAGGGGHLSAVLGRGPGPVRGLALDRDPAALAEAASRVSADKCRFVHAGFAELAAVLRASELPAPAAILADLGVSSHQIDTASRGFSFQTDAQLDMRMDTSRGPTLAEVLPTLSEQQLTRILRELGEESDAPRISRAIVKAKPQTTRQLGDVVRAAMSAPQLRQIGLRIHPATRTFQALRIFLNQELEQLDTLLATAPELLAVGGRLAIITFHSLEDRRVKQAFAALSRAEQPPPGVPLQASALPQPRFCVPYALRHGSTPGEEELAANPRSRSSRLRVLERRAP